MTEMLPAFGHDEDPRRIAWSLFDRVKSSAVVTVRPPDTALKDSGESDRERRSRR